MNHTASAMWILFQRSMSILYLSSSVSPLTTISPLKAAFNSSILALDKSDPSDFAMIAIVARIGLEVNDRCWKGYFQAGLICVLSELRLLRASAINPSAHCELYVFVSTLLILSSSGRQWDLSLMCAKISVLLIMRGPLCSTMAITSFPLAS